MRIASWGVKRWAGSSLDEIVGVYMHQRWCVEKIRLYPFSRKNERTPSLKILIRAFEFYFLSAIAGL